MIDEEKNWKYLLSKSESKQYHGKINNGRNKLWWYHNYSFIYFGISQSFPFWYSRNKMSDKTVGVEVGVWDGDYYGKTIIMVVS